jgi:hypothetical protein
MMTRIPLLALTRPLVLAVRHRLHDGDDPSRAAIPNEIGTICTIAGSGENGYDRDADLEALPALEAKFSLPQDTLTAPDGTSSSSTGTTTACGGCRTGWFTGWPAAASSAAPRRPGQRRLQPPDQHHLRRDRGRASSSRPGTTARSARSTATGEVATPAATASARTSATAVPPRPRRSICRRASRSIRGEPGDHGPGQPGAAHHRRRDIHLLAGDASSMPRPRRAPGPCADGEEPVQCPDGPNGPSGKFVCGDPAEFCARPCTPGYCRRRRACDRAAHVAAVRAVGVRRPAASPSTRGQPVLRRHRNHLIRMIDTDGIVRRVAGTPPTRTASPVGVRGRRRPGDLEAKLNFPVDLALGDDGTFYFTDVRNHCVRAIDGSGTISTVVGICGEKGFEGDGGLPRRPCSTCRSVSSTPTVGCSSPTPATV